MTNPLVITVMPVFNEEGNLEELLRQLDAACESLPCVLLHLFVNDGSGPETRGLLNNIAERRSDVRVLHLSRNFGHQAALSAGLAEAYALGAEAAISLDSDLQHPPRVLPELFAQWQAGYEVVYTIRDDTAPMGLFKRMSAAAFYRLIAWLSETSIHPGTADFRLLGRRALKELTLLPERGRFLRGLTSWLGFRQLAIHYSAEPRFSGRSKYTLARMYRLGIDGIVSMSTMPLRAILLVGLALSAVSLAYLVYVTAAHFLTNRTLPGWSSVIVSVLLLGGMNLTVLGVIGLYIAKIYDEVKARPNFLIEERRGYEAVKDKHAESRRTTA